MLTGWAADRASAGSVDSSRWKDAVCYVKNDCDGLLVTGRIELTEPEQSSTTPYDIREAANALNGNADSIIHTLNGVSGWWTAKLNGAEYTVQSVSLKNRADGWGERLGGATVEVDG